MTMIQVVSLHGALSTDQREQLGEKLTNAVLEVEAGKDTPAARAGVMVRFEELSGDQWFHGGRRADELYGETGIFWVTATVMEGPWTPALRRELVKRLVDQLREVVGRPEPQTIWATMHQVPDGSWSVNGDVVGIEQLLWAFEPDRKATIEAMLARANSAST